MGKAATGSLRKLPSGRWQARFTGPDGVRRPAPVTFQTKRDAQAWLAGQQADVSRSRWAPRAATVAVAFEDYAARWLDRRRVKGRPLAARTLAGYQDLLDRFLLPTFASSPVHTIEREQVERWYDRCAPGHPTYRARAYGLLRAVLASAVDEGHLAANPARIRGAGAVERAHVVRPASLAELETLVAAMPPRYRLLVLLAAWCALRFGELTELRRGDVDARDGVLHVRRGVVRVAGRTVVGGPKTAAGVRDVAVPPHLLPAVRAHLAEHVASGQDSLLFPAAGDPTAHLAPSTLSKVFYPARERAGRPDLRLHDLRHTGAVLAAQTGATLAELMGRLGHATPGAAMRYQTAAAGRDMLIAQRLSDLAGQ